MSDRAIERLQAGFEITLEMHPQRAPAALGQHVEIATRLRRLDHAEAGFLAGHGQIPGLIGCDLQEDAAIGAALIGLSGGMQETRTEFRAGRDMALVAHRKPHGLQCGDMRGIAFDIGKQRHIIRGTCAREVSL